MKNGVHGRSLGVIFGFVFLAISDLAWANRIALVYTGPGVDDKIGQNTIQAIQNADAHSDIKVFTTPAELVNFLSLNTETAKNYALVIPGGNAAKMAKALTEVRLSKTDEPGIQAIDQFIRQGGNYLGICAGSNLASKRIYLEDSPDFVNPNWNMAGLVKVNAYWPSHGLKVGEEAKGQWVELETPDKKKFKSFWHMGSFLVDADDPQGLKNPNIQVLARYTHAKQKEAIGAVSSSHGEGKVIACAFHPEATPAFAKQRFNSDGPGDTKFQYTHTDFWKELLVRSGLLASVEKGAESVKARAEKECVTKTPSASFPTIINLNENIEKVTEPLFKNFQK